MKLKKQHLLNYIQTLQSNGRYTFTREEAITNLCLTPDAFKLAALRLIKKKQLARPKQGFYVIVPTEYQKIGVPPAAWYIDSLMRFNQQDYYVGLLSAAALHGAAHQQPQVFQVLSTKTFRAALVGRTKLEFFHKKNINSTSYQQLKTPTGYMNVSIPEMTALDLIKYVRSAGYLSHVATILSELQEKFDMTRFTQLLKTEKLESPHLQRMGYILELIEADKEIILLIKSWVNDHNPCFTPLRPDIPYKDATKNLDWRLYINELIESDV